MHRVLYITPSVRMLGARQSLLQIVAGFAASGRDSGAKRASEVEPHVLAPAAGELTERLDELGIGWTPLMMRPWRKAKGWIFIPGTLRRLMKILVEREIDMIHCNEIYPTPYAVVAAARAAKQLGRPLPVLTHLRLERDPGFFQKYRVGETDGLIAVSDAVAQGVIRDCGAEIMQRLHTVANAIDIQAFREAAHFAADTNPALADLERRIALLTQNDGRPPFVLGQFGLLSQRKRHSDVFRALQDSALAGDAMPRILYVVIGDLGPRAGQDSFAHPREGAEKLGLAWGDQAEPASKHAALFYSTQQQIAPFFQRADAVVLPSEREGFGRVLIEAAVLGKPSIGANTGGIPSVIQDGETGLLFPCGDSGALANRLAMLAADPELRDRLGNAAMKRAEERYSLATHLEALNSIYSSIIG